MVRFQDGVSISQTCYTAQVSQGDGGAASPGTFHSTQALVSVSTEPKTIQLSGKSTSNQQDELIHETLLQQLP